MNIEVPVNFLVKHRLTFEQYALCYMLHEDRYQVNKKGQRVYLEAGPAIANVYKYSKGVRKWAKDEVEDLIQRGYLRRNGDRNSPDLLDVTDKFSKAVFRMNSDFEELFRIYPEECQKDRYSPRLILKACNRAEVARMYKNLVRTREKHLYIINVTLWARDQNMLVVPLKDYVKNKYWEVLQHKYENQRTGVKYAMV